MCMNNKTCDEYEVGTVHARLLPLSLSCERKGLERNVCLGRESVKRKKAIHQEEKKKERRSKRRDFESFL